MSFYNVDGNLVNLNNITFISDDEFNEKNKIIHFIGDSKLRLPKEIVEKFMNNLEKK